MRKKKKQVLEQVAVENYAAEGKSIARWEGKALFIEKVVPGDVVDVQLFKNKKDWAEGFPVHFHSYSPDRVDPFCQHFGVCGGCQWQMLPYQKQLQYKQQQVWDNLSRIGQVALPEFEPIIGADEDRFYRNKLEYTFSTKEFVPAPLFKKKDRAAAQPEAETDWAQSDEQAAAAAENALGDSNDYNRAEGVLGFHAKGLFDKVVNIEKCWLQAEPTNALRNAVRDFARQQQLSFYDYRAHEGLLRNMMVRICTTGEVMVNVIFGQDNKKQVTRVMDFIAREFPQVTSLLYTINQKKNDSIFDLEPRVFSGKDHILEQLTTSEGETFRFKIGPKSFFQTNTPQGEKLYRATRELAELDGTQTVYDLYCGTGSIGIFCSSGARKIIGVETIAEAVADAKENAALNGIEHAEFFAGDVIKVCTDDFFQQHGRPDVVITDPPRAGMHRELVDKILQTAAPTVVYVSCNPATQARDLRLLDEKYAVTRVQPVDMFPHTHHIENIVQLKLRP